MKSYLLAPILALALAAPAIACGGGTVDRALAAKSQLSLLDTYLANPQKLEAVRHSPIRIKQGVEILPLTPEQIAEARALRNESAQLATAAMGQRVRNGVKSKLAELQFERAHEKAGQALLVLGAPAVAPGGPCFPLWRAQGCRAKYMSPNCPEGLPGLNPPDEHTTAR